MNKNVTGIILIILAAVAVWWGWGKMQPYMNTGGGDAGTEQTTETQPLI